MHDLLKKAASKVFGYFGYVIVPEWRISSYSQAVYLKKLFDYCKIDCVFDVGANEGQYARFLRTQVGYDGLIISFEPIPTCADILRNLAADDKMWVVEEVALGLEQKITQFNVMAGTQFSSFLKPDSSRTQMFVGQNRLAEEISVQVKTLKEYMPRVLKEYGCFSPYLKLDTQGFDLNVAHGAGSTLAYFRAVQTGVSVTPILENMPDYIQSIS